jgi:hypothetical protein
MAGQPLMKQNVVLEGSMLRSAYNTGWMGLALSVVYLINGPKVSEDGEKKEDRDNRSFRY